MIFLRVKNYIFRVSELSSIYICENGTALCVITANNREHIIYGEGKNQNEKQTDIKKLFTAIHQGWTGDAGVEWGVK